MPASEPRPTLATSALSHSFRRMFLRDVIQAIADFPEDGFILAEQPWSPSSRAVVREFPDDPPVDDMTDDGRIYFLEVSVARDLLEDLRNAGWSDGDALCERVVQYAINDA